MRASGCCTQQNNGCPTMGLPNVGAALLWRYFDLMEIHRKILSYFLIDRITDSKASFQWSARNCRKSPVLRA